MPSRYLPVNWQFPTSVTALFSTRAGGYSAPPYDSFNLATHVGDREEAVTKNHQQLMADQGINNICWLSQVHGTRVIRAIKPTDTGMLPAADAVWASEPGIACAILVADCMPVLVTNRQGSVVGAAHAGWRGLCAGVIPNLLEAMALDPEDALVWLGPAIGQDAFEVGPEVLDSFQNSRPFQGLEVRDAFVSGQGDRLHADLYKLAKMQLSAMGCRSIFYDNLCTYTHSDRFFSYRREGATGRMAALIWINS